MDFRIWMFYYKALFDITVLIPTTTVVQKMSVMPPYYLK